MRPLVVGFVVALAACRSSSTPRPTAPGEHGLEVQVVGGSAEQTGGRVVVLLHGWGAPGDDLVPLARELADPQTRFVVPAAPLPHPQGGRAWWHLDLARVRRSAPDDPAVAREVPPGLVEARDRRLALLRQVRQRYQPRSLSIAGFSQGGMMAMDVGLAASPPVDSIVVLSGRVVAEDVWRQHLARAKVKTPVFVSHGRADAILSFASGERVKTLLEEHQFPVTWLPFEGGHAIPPPVVQAMSTFIARLPE
jgi:phospholipase/carboxylesterase